MKVRSLAALAICGLSAPVHAQALDPAMIYEGSLNCAAYHIYAAAEFESGSPASQAEEEAAMMFVEAAFLSDPRQKQAVAEAEIEGILEGLLADKQTAEPAQHAKDIGELKAACAAMEPLARQYLAASAPAAAGSSVN